MKKYMLTGGLAAVLMLSACGNEEPEVNEEAAAEESTDESADANREELEELNDENESLQVRIAELEEENEELKEMAEDIAEEDQADEEVESNEEPEVADDETSQESSSTGEGTRSNPMQLGDTSQLVVTINGDDYDDQYEAAVNLTVDDIIIGDEAYDMLVEENPYNDPAPEGYQWALIHSEIELVESETDDYSYYVMDLFEVVEDDGSSASRESAVTPEEYGGEDIYSGGTSSGYSSILVPEDGDFLIKYDGFSSNTIFFEVN